MSAVQGLCREAHMNRVVSSGLGILIRWLMPLVVVLALIPLSAISYHLVEKPARERMKAWAGGWRERRPATAKAG